MKIIVIILCVLVAAAITYYLVQPKEKSIFEQTDKLIDSLDQKRYDDSVKIDHETQIRLAKEKAKQR